MASNSNHPDFDSPSKYLRIDDDSSQSEDGFSRHPTPFPTQRTPKRKLPNNQKSGYFDAVSSKAKIPKKMSSFVFDSPAKSQSIDVDSSPSTGFGLDETIKPLPRTPIRKLSLNSSFMLKRFLAASPQAHITVDDSPSKSESAGIVDDDESEAVELAAKMAALRSPGRNILYTRPRKQDERSRDNSGETNVVPESQSPIQSDISKIDNWWEDEVASVDLDKTPVPNRFASPIHPRPIVPPVQIGSEEIIDYSPFNSQPKSQSQHFIHDQDSNSGTYFDEIISREMKASSSTKRFLDAVRHTPRRRILNSDSLDITVDASPSKSEIEQREREKVRDTQGVSLLKEKLNLAENLKRTVKEHEFHVRDWTNKMLKNSGSGNDTGAIHLFVVKCFKLSGVHEKGHLVLLSLCVHLPMAGVTNSSDFTWKWVIFRSQLQNPKQIIPGLSLVKLYPPWQQISLLSHNEDVAICTDFYQFVDPPDIQIDLKILKCQIKAAKSEMDRKVSCFFNSGSPHPTLLNVVPYKIRNMKTLRKQVVLRRRSIDMDVVICHVWYYEKSIGILVKDSDNILSYVEASPNDENLVENLCPGKFFKLEGLMIRQKVTPKVWLPLFSVISAFGGGKQAHAEKFYYKLLLTQASKWEVVPELQILFTGSNCPTKNVKDLNEIPENVDCRLIVEGRVVLDANESWEFQFHDQEDSTFNIRVKVMHAFGEARIAGINSAEPVQLIFMRLFRGIATLDQFSSIKQ